LALHIVLPGTGLRLGCVKKEHIIAKLENGKESDHPSQT
jgi:hypothetical protein